MNPLSLKVVSRLILRPYCGKTKRASIWNGRAITEDGTVALKIEKGLVFTACCIRLTCAARQGEMIGSKQS